MNTPEGDEPNDRQHSGGASQPPVAASAVEPPLVADKAQQLTPDERSRRRKWLVLAGIGVIVLGITIGVGIWYFTSPRTADSPSEATGIYLEAIKERDTEQAGAVLCNAITKGKEVEVSDEYNVTKLNYTVGTPQQVSPTEFHVPVSVEAEFSGDDGTTTRKDTPIYQVIKEDGHWKVCGFAPVKSTGESGADGTNSR